MLSKLVKNTVAKGEIFFSYSVVKRLELQTRKNKGLFGKGLTHYHTMPPFDTLEIYSFGKHCEKRRKGELL